MTQPELRRLFTAGLYEMNWFENAWIKILGQFIRADNFTNIATTLKKERAWSQEHVNRIRVIFNSLEEPLERMQSRTSSGLIADLAAASSLAAKNDFESDVSLLLTIIKATNYQIGAYSGILELASAMQYDYIEGLLVDTISEEKQTILTLTKLLSEYIQAAETA